MRKRIIAMMLTLAIIISVALGTEITTTAVAEGIYNQKLFDAMDSIVNAGFDLSGYGYSSSRAFLYDFDNNGQEELVIYYFDKENDRYNTPKRVISVYTVKNNEVKTLIKSKKLYCEVAGPFGFAGVFKKNGKKYLVCQGENGETGGGTAISRSGAFYLYEVKGTKIKKQSTVKYKLSCNIRKNKINKKGTKITINGKEITYKKFLQWLDSFKLSKCKKSSGSYWKYVYSCKGEELYSHVYVGDFN